jgi:predicted alpha/beta superfamily hydrolase
MRCAASNGYRHLIETGYPKERSMKKLAGKRCFVACALLTLLPSILCAGETIEIGQRISLHSEILDEDRSLLVYLPESYDSSDFRYPVLFLLDGDSEFFHTAGIVEFLAGAGRIPEMIIVGVVNTVRSRDLTPESRDTEEVAFWPAVGGADQFLRFFQNELIPFVDESFRTVPYRVIRGQSFGGLLAIYDMMSPSPTFNAYLTSSPVVGWNFDTLIKHAPEFFEDGVPRPLYIAAAGRDFPKNLDSIQRFARVIESRHPDDDRWQFDFYESEGHYSLVHLATYRALEFLYQGWEVPDEVVAGARFEDYELHYRQLSEKYGYTISIPMQTVIRLGNTLLRSQRFEDGIRIHKHNIELYPNQPESYWYVGEAYRLSGQTGEAKEYFKVALRKALETGAPDLADYQKALEDLEAAIEDQPDEQEPAPNAP